MKHSIPNFTIRLIWRATFLFLMGIFPSLLINKTLHADPAGQTKTIVIAESAAVYFTGNESRRTIQLAKTLPATLDGYSKAYLRLTLSCPNQRCDPWDRVGYIRLRPSLEMVEAGHAEQLEMVRFITPYGIGGSWTQDVSDFMIYLTNNVTFEVFIDTWVGPGHEAGEGWLVSLELILQPGTQEKKVLAIVPILDFSSIDYGDPKNPAIRSGLLNEIGFASSMKIRSLITGHGQGNHQNCAEFCSKRHDIRLGKQNWSRQIWRNDCHVSVNPNQAGNYHFPRAGWCPGDIVRPWEINVDQAVVSEELTWQYQVEDYINSCRPDSPVCQGCVLGTSCEYDGGRHTAPIYYTTVQAILYQ